ncbi:MAG: Uma2 family endonuclease [Planctomycetales bacterium]|nr:Uma2 family endonuclease [Planctomycetales bacterium]
MSTNAASSGTSTDQVSVATFTVDSLDRMSAAGVFDHLDDSTRVELVRGEICYMAPPPNPEHDTIVDLLNEWSFGVVDLDKVRVRVQNAIGMAAIDSLTVPDLTWVKRENYRHARPGSSQVLLLIEVSETSLARDRGDKAAMYAAAGIADYWIVNLRDQVVEVHRKPLGDAYSEKFTVGREGKVSPLVLPQASLAVNDLWEDS